MSIIQEALKRAQYNYAAKKSQPQAYGESVTGPTVTVSSDAVDSRAITKKIAIVVYILVLLALVMGFAIRVLFLKIADIDKEKRLRNLSAQSQLKAPDIHDGSSDAIRTVSHPYPTGRLGQVPDLVLNGIMYFPDKPKAIINGTVVRVGDVVGGATITSITENNVLVKYNNSDNQVEMVLKIKE